MQRQERDAVVGATVVGAGEKRIGRVEAAFADYLLVRTASIIPVDLYVPRPELAGGEAGPLSVTCSPAEAYRRWHRPLRRAPHE